MIETYWLSREHGDQSDPPMLEDIEMLAAVRAESDGENEAEGAELKDGEEQELEADCMEREAEAQADELEFEGPCNDSPPETFGDEAANNVPNTNAGIKQQNSYSFSSNTTTELNTLYLYLNQPILIHAALLFIFFCLAPSKKDHYPKIHYRKNSD